ncbi:MAG: tRNA-guanine transglycosylase [Candidatus Odinarchaeota archaeon]
MNGHEYKYDDVEGFRTGEFRLKNGKKIQTPVFWLGYLFNGIKPWEQISEKENDFQIDNILINAYEIIKKEKMRKGIENEGLRGYLNFKGNILMDSGGFLFQKKQVMDIEPETISELYDRLKPDMAVILDHPFSPREDKETNKNRWKKTLENTRIMMETGTDNGTTLLMPVIHGYSRKELDVAFEEVRKISEPEVIGLGSMVPLFRFFNAFSMINAKERPYLVIDLIRRVREAFPDAFLHVFGVGGTTTMHLLYSLGVDSIDSVAWRLKAAYGAIQLPGVGDRFVVSKNRKKGRVQLDDNKKDVELLGQCKCPICKEKEIKERLDALDNTKAKTFEKRAIHNAWTYLYESKAIQKEIKEGDPHEFTDKRLEKSLFRKFFEYSKKPFKYRYDQTAPLTSFNPEIRYLG